MTECGAPLSRNCSLYIVDIYIYIYICIYIQICMYPLEWGVLARERGVLLIVLCDGPDKKRNDFWPGPPATR